MTATGELIVGEILVVSTAILATLGWVARRLRLAADVREQRQLAATDTRNEHVDHRLDTFENALEVMARGQALTVAQLQPLTTRVDQLETRSHTLSENVAVLANTVDVSERYYRERDIRHRTSEPYRNSG